MVLVLLNLKFAPVLVRLVVICPVLVRLELAPELFRVVIVPVLVRLELAP